MNTQELFAKFETLCEAFKVEHEGKSKAAQARARKIAGEIKKLAAEYRKASVAESKAK